MKNNTAILSGSMTGIILLFAGIINSASAQVIKELQSKYSFTETVELITAEAKQKSWNIPVVHDLQKSLAKSGQEVRPVTIIEICKPEYSGKLLSLDHERIISVFMPCRISVYEKKDGRTYIALIDGEALAENQPQNVAQIMKSASDEIFEIVKKVTD